MKRNIYLIVFIHFFSIGHSQTYRASFDYLDQALNSGQGYSFYCNADNSLSGESLELEAYLTMYRASKDKKYLDKFIIKAKRVQDRRDDFINNLPSNQLVNIPANLTSSVGDDCPINDNPTQSCIISGTSQVPSSSLGWSYVEDACHCEYNVQRVLHSGQLTYPMAEFAYLVKAEEPALGGEPVPAEAQGTFYTYYNVQT